MTLARVCVFCGSAPGRDPRYVEAARGFGALLARQGVEVVTGGGRVGMMGAVAEGALGAGGRVIGVIPGLLMEREKAHPGLSERSVTASMHERKQRMAALSGAFVALPGAFGTFEELCEMVTWTQLGIHQKPLGLLDVLGYWRALLALFDHAVGEGFLTPENRALVLSHADGQALLDALARAHPARPAAPLAPENA